MKLADGYTPISNEPFSMEQLITAKAQALKLELQFANERNDHNNGSVHQPTLIQSIVNKGLSAVLSKGYQQGFYLGCEGSADIREEFNQLTEEQRGELKQELEKVGLALDTSHNSFWFYPLSTQQCYSARNADY